MGLGDYLSESAEIKYIRSERKKEMWEVENIPEMELSEMITIYKEKGVAQEDATTILSTMMKYKDLFVDHMMIMELGLQTPDPDDNPAKNGLVTFGSFVAFGSVPMWVYLVVWGTQYDDRQGAFGIACGFTAATMFLLGATQAKLTRQPIVMTGLSMMMNGCVAAAAAYLIGWGLDHAIGKGDGC
jgi:DNA damage-binding protein 1